MAETSVTAAAASALSAAVGEEEGKKNADATFAGSSASAGMARKSSMGPPPAPISSSPTAPRMTRLPSLQQITDRLHIPSPLSTHSPSSSNIDPAVAHWPSSAGVDSKQNTSPKPKLAINPSSSSSTSASASATSPLFTSSPSTRLKLPASAMMRSHSSSSATGGGSSQTLPTIAQVEAVKSSKEEGDTPLFTDPFTMTPNHSRQNSGKGNGEAQGGESMSRGPSRDGYIKGYKDVPTLSQIRQRVGSTVSLRGSISGQGQGQGHPDELKPRERTQSIIPQLVTPKESADRAPSPPESGSSSATTATTSSVGELLPSKNAHPLAHSWTMYFDAKGFKPNPGHVAPRDGGGDLTEYEKSLVTVGKFDTVEGFARYVNNVRLPSQLAKNSNYHLFKNGIRPMWEDPANANGGKWVMHLRNAPQLLDVAWANLTMALVGEILDPEDEVCGVVASSKPRADRIQIWTRGKEPVEKVNALARRIIEIVGLEGREVESMSLEFQFNNSSSSPPPGTYLHIPFPSRSISYAPPTPSKLALPQSPALTLNHPSSSSSASGGTHTLTHHPSLPQMPKSPLSPRSPLLPRQGDTLVLPGHETGSSGRAGPTPMARQGSAGSAFAGPMGGGGLGRSSGNIRTGSPQLMAGGAK